MTDTEKERFVIEHEGEEHLFEELFHFTVEETGISYMVLIPVENNAEAGEDGEVEVFAFRYEESESEGEKGQVSFYPIENDQEWDMIEEMLNTFTQEEQ
ncbi:MAG TPA: DUF1292 domain-containing protein [Bacillales bacterium]|nr:DUF1292 domain-containing protein [Bacillales bacterium]